MERLNGYEGCKVPNVVEGKVVISFNVGNRVELLNVCSRYGVTESFGTVTHVDHGQVYFTVEESERRTWKAAHNVVFCTTLL